MFIVIEGQDGTGKDTQAKLLTEYLEKTGQKTVFYAESGSSSTEKFVRGIADLNLDKTNDIDSRTHAMLYLINRYEQWRRIAEPVLKEGGNVILSRNWLSTLIYEGYCGTASRSTIIKMHKLIMPEYYFKPDKIVILTLTEEERAARRKAQGERTSFEVFKSKPEDFHAKLNRAYLKVAKEYNIPTMSAAGTPEEVNQRLLELFGI